MSQVELNELPRISKDEFLSLVEAFRAKYAYEKAKKEYEEKPLFQRAFSSRPVDPYEGYTLFQIGDAVTTAFSALHPMLNRSWSNGDGSVSHARTVFSFDLESCEPRLDSFSVYKRSQSPDKSAMLLSHYEVFSFSPGKGFVLERSSGNSPERLVGSEFDSYYGSLKLLGESGFLTASKNSHPGLDEFMRLYDKIWEYRRAKLSNSEIISNRVSLISHRAVSLESFIRGELLSRQHFFAMENEPLRQYQFSRNERMIDASRSLSVVTLYRLANRDARPRHTLDSLLDRYASKERMDTEKGRRNALDRFVAAALDSGFSKKDVGIYVETFMQSRYPSDSFRPSYDVIERERAGVYYSYVISRIDSAFTNGIRVAAKVKIQTPCRRFEREVVREGAAASVSEKAGKVSSVQEKGMADAKPSAGMDFLCIRPDNIGSVSFPEGVSVHRTDAGLSFLDLNSVRLQVPEDGIFLVKEKGGKTYEAHTRKTFSALYNVGPDGIVTKKVPVNEKKEGLRARKSGLTNK